MLYRHRVPTKGAPYEESQGIPLVVRGPGVKEGGVSEELVANIDLAPTMARWAGIKPPAYVDGRSLVPLLSGDSPPWRRRLLFEFFGPYETRPDHPYAAVRAKDTVYIEYPTHERELYELSADP